MVKVFLEGMVDGTKFFFNKSHRPMIYEKKNTYREENSKKEIEYWLGANLSTPIALGATCASVLGILYSLPN